MNKIYATLALSAFLTACGGGGSGDRFSSNTIFDIQGDWITNCITRSDGTSAISSYTFDTANSGNDFFVTGFSNYETSNCTGDGDITVLGGDVIYRGEQANSVCIAEKIDLFVLSGGDGIDDFEGSDLVSFLDDEGLPDRDFDIACAPNNVLFLGDNTANLDGSSSDRRPTEVDTSLAFFPTDLSSRPTKGQKNDLKSAMQRNVSLLKRATAE